MYKLAIYVRKFGSASSNSGKPACKSCCCNLLLN